MAEVGRLDGVTAWLMEEFSDGKGQKKSVRK